MIGPAMGARGRSTQARSGPAALARSAGLLAIASLLALGRPAWGQDRVPPLFAETIDVTVVNLEVFVTANDGRRVTGLTREDFEILEDGQPVEISNFYAVARMDRLLRSVDVPGLPAMRTPPPEELPRNQQLSLVVLVDHFNLRPFSRNRVLDELEGFLEDRLRQGDHVMMVGAYRSPQVLTDLTRDRAEIADALRRLAKARTYRQMDDALRRQRTSLMNSAFDDGDVQAALQSARSYIESTRTDLRRTARIIKDVVRSLAGLPGRKALLYVSEGLPRRPGEEMYQHLEDLFGQRGLQERGRDSQILDPLFNALSEDEGHLFDAITREANAHQTTLYTLDASGLGPGTSGAETRGLAAATGGRTVTDALRTQNLQEPLIQMADATGGRSILNTFSYERALFDFADDFDSFYSLGYVRQAGGDGNYHKVEVRVRQPGFTVRHRSGFVDKPQLEKAADRTMASLVFDMEANPLGVAVDFGPQQTKKRNETLLPVLVRVPIGELALVPTEAAEQGRLQFFVIVQSEDGNVSAIHREPYPVSVPRDRLAEALGSELGYGVTLRVRPGLSTVAIGVLDELSGVESYVRKQVRVERKRKS